MKPRSDDYVPVFATPRLVIEEVYSELNQACKSGLLTQAIELLSADVVKSLPPDFHGITSLELAEQWFLTLSAQSRIMVIKRAELGPAIGFIFLYESSDRSAHVGYLLGQHYWGKGYAKEFLRGLIKWCEEQGSLSSLRGGVEMTNLASKKLLTALGFVEVSAENGVLFYQYRLRE